MTAYGTYTDVDVVMFLNTTPAPVHLPGALPDATGGALANLVENAGVPNYKTMNAAELKAFAALLRVYLKPQAWGQVVAR